LSQNICYYIWLFMVGSCVGSFLNVCLVRLPKKESIVFPPSHCPICEYRLKWYNNIPIFSYFIQKGKCSNCKKTIPIKYLWMELVWGLIFVFIFKVVYVDIFF
jgi:leader peptidase (prepilin peptidase)/N-methyltransferase